MWIRLVILEQHIETRLVLLDQVRLEDKSFDLVIDDDELEIGDGLYQATRLRVLISAGLKILPNTIAQILCLADIQDLSNGIFMQVDPGCNGHGLEFFAKVDHVKNLTLWRINNQNTVATIVFNMPLRKTHFVKTLLTQYAETAAEFIRKGGIVAFPTETVYGLGADIFNEGAILKIFEAKKRPSDNPLIAHVGSIDQIKDLAASIPANAQTLIDAFFPGALTIVFQKAKSVPLVATAGLDTIGIRMPSTALAREFMRACGVPVVAPSANLSGRPSPTSWQAVFEDLDGHIDCILQADPTVIGLESTVVDCTSDVPVLLRKGGVPLESLRKFIPGIRDYSSDESGSPRSPGLKHKHYSPTADVILIRPDEPLKATSADAFIGLRERTDPFKIARICANAEAYARELFEFFRECDRLGVKRIFCETVVDEGIGAALMDRITRAAAD